MVDDQLTQSTEARLRERIKELECFYSIVKVGIQPAISLEEMLQSIVELLPPAWQYPEIAAAGIMLDGISYTTPGFFRSHRKQTVDIVIEGVTRGVVEVVYVEDKPEFSVGMFLKEERNLIEAIAQQLVLIIKHKHTEDEIRKANTYINAMGDALIVLDMERNVIHLNAAGINLFGYSQKEMLGLTFEQLFPEREHVEHYKKMKAVIEDYELKPFETFGITKDGKEIPILLSGTIMKNTEGENIGFVGVCKDITEQKQLETERKIYKEKVLEAQKHAYIGTMGAIVAHQLNQPLTTINMRLGKALEISKEKENRHHEVLNNIEKSLSEAKKAASIIQKFRQYSKSSALEGTGKINVSLIADRIISVLSEIAMRAKMRVSTKGLGDLPEVEANEIALEQIFLVIIQNAIEAADGQKPHKLDITGKVIDGNVELRFADDCSGIAPENLDKIFEPFFSIKIEDKGLGLGLDIVQQILISCGGQIRVESQLGEGTTFYVTLPISDTLGA